MFHLKKGAALAVLSFTLTACVSNPSLQTQLQGKPAIERQQLLLDNCHKTAQEGDNTQASGHYHRNTQKMIEICNLMAREFPTATSIQQ